MPVTPSGHDVLHGRKVTAVTMHGAGEVNLPGELALLNTTLDFLLPAQDYGRTYQYHYYLIFGELEDGTPCVLQNADSQPRNKYNGSDIYQQIHIGQVYTFFTTGERDYRRAQYPNIITILDRSESWEQK